MPWLQPAGKPRLLFSGESLSRLAATPSDSPLLCPDGHSQPLGQRHREALAQVFQIRQPLAVWALQD